MNIVVDIGQRDLPALRAQIARAQRELGKSLEDSLKWAGVFICRSLGAATRVSPKKRPIVRNPDKRYKTDHRRAPFGVMAPSGPLRELDFMPIFRTGEYGKIRFYDKKSFSWFERSKGGGKWEKWPSGPDVANPKVWAPGIMSDKRRIITRSGMAKRSWTELAPKINKGGHTIMFGQYPSMTTYEKNMMTDELHIMNQLHYMPNALVGGRQSIDGTIARATANMYNRIDDRVAKIAATANSGGGL